MKAGLGCEKSRGGLKWSHGADAGCWCEDVSSVLRWARAWLCLRAMVQVHRLVQFGAHRGRWVEMSNQCPPTLIPPGVGRSCLGPGVHKEEEVLSCLKWGTGFAGFPAAFFFFCSAKAFHSSNLRRCSLVYPTTSNTQPLQIPQHVIVSRNRHVIQE
jgi:hypothetical protein